MERSNSMMRKKRGLDSNDSEEGGNSNNKRPAFASVVEEAGKMDNLQQLRSYLASIIHTELRSSMAPIIRTELSSLGPILRKVVSEEIELALAKLDPTRMTGRSSQEQKRSSNGRNLQLHFKTRLLPLFSDAKVEGEHGSTVDVVLLDSNTGEVVTSGPESSVKLNVVVLEGDFKNEDDDNWTQEEFKMHVVKEREGKRPLLTGELQVTLKEGEGTLGNLTFTDNSSWIRSKKFRLGLEVASGFCEGLRIREAKTNAVKVKDHRGESSRKSYPPASDDEVWRLEKIGKDGIFHKRLKKAGINTVKDFLRLANRDSIRLRTILGHGMSNKIWETLIEHAKTCKPSGKLYVFYDDDTKNVGVVFNNFYELSGLIAGGQCDPADSLSDTQKGCVDALVKKAYDNWTEIIEYDGQGLMSFKQNKQPNASQSDVPLSRQDFPTSVDLQRSLPVPVIPLPPSQPLIASDLIITGDNNDDSGTSYLMDPQENADANVQFEGFIAPQYQLISASHEAQPTYSDIRVGMALSQLQVQASIPEFQTVGPPVEPSNLTAEEIDEMLENEDMQHLHPTFSTDDHNSVNETEDMHLLYSPCVSFPSAIYSLELDDHTLFPVTGHNQDEEDQNVFDFLTTNYSSDEDHYRSSRKAVIGWLKMKAAMRWGTFIRKKAAERRAQLVELDD